MTDDWLTILPGDCREVLATLPAESVNCVVTSPPYWGLRDYGTATWEGGSEDCEHKGQPLASSSSSLAGYTSDNVKVRTFTVPYRDTCGKCGARRIDSQLGLEPTPEEYVANLVAVFREVRRVLTKDGTVWLNLGDSYAGSSQTGGTDPSGLLGYGNSGTRDVRATFAPRRGLGGVKPKDLVGIPWRVAFALQQPYYTGAIPGERDRTWLAALLDGEGTFTILSTTSPHGSGNSYPPVAQVRMTSEAVVQKAASLVGVASPAQYPPSNRGNRAVYQWRLSGGRAAAIAREMYPYLIEKRKQALIVWNHQVVRDSYETKRGVTIPAAALAKQHVCRGLIRRLNHGEDVDIPSWMVEPPGMTEPGWYLRSDVIWAKPNPMPESVTDRPTRSHEYVFLLTKSARYFFDAEAVREDGAGHIWNSAKGFSPNGLRARLGVGTAGGEQWNGTGTHEDRNATGRNIRTVWTIATQPYPGAHFATFPEALVEPCIKAGTSERGVCPVCGAAWVRRVVEREPIGHTKQSGIGVDTAVGTKGRAGGVSVSHIGWAATCDHDAEPVPAVVLDPFGGSGTTARVANRLSRRAVLIELNPDYIEQAEARNAQAPLGLGA